MVRVTIRPVCACLLFLGLGFGATSKAAHARNVVIEAFQGRDAAAARSAVLSAIGDIRGWKPVSDRALVRTESRLGIARVSDNYPGAAKALRASAFVRGRSGASGLQLVVRDIKGEVVGRTRVKGGSRARLAAAIEKQLPDRLRPILMVAVGQRLARAGGAKAGAPKRPRRQGGRADSRRGRKSSPVAPKGRREVLG